MILYCCCLDVDGDTDSHPSSSPSCFGSFYFVMKLSTRDRNVIAAIDTLNFEAANTACILTISCSAKNLMKQVDMARRLIRDECDEVTIQDDGIYYGVLTAMGEEGFGFIPTGGIPF